MESQKPETRQDEIDLGKIFTRLGDFSKTAWIGFMRFLALLRRVPFENKLSFSLIITITVAIGVVFTFFINKNYYESKMILSSDYLNKRLAENTIDKLDLLAREPSKKGLARTLGLKDSLADNIIGFAVQPFVEEKDIVELEVLKEQLRNAQPTTANNKQIIDQVIERIEIENRHAFEITVRTLNPEIIPNLQEAIVGYFERNPYIKKRIEVNRENLRKKTRKLGSDVDKLDSLKNVIYLNYKNMAAQDRGSNNVILSDKSVTDPVEVYSAAANVYTTFQNASRDLYLKKDFEVVDGFTEFSEPASPSIPTMLFYSILIGIAFAYADVALRSFNKYLANLK
jgi:hypothetical protein